ncbi:hypothetical protein EDB85DRAFT_1899607 [Lactarius pseudohatsudake]|nr:hypothetical protein EDB85DRAFT_1899607 [Lactarius pseudohatsudake]
MAAHLSTKSDVHPAAKTENSHEPTESIFLPHFLQATGHRIVEAPQMSEDLGPVSVMRVTTGSIQSGDLDTVLNLSRDATPRTGPEKQSAESQGHIPVVASVHRGDSVISQAHINHDVTMQAADELALTPEAFYVLCQRVDTESVQYHTRFQSLLQRVMVLEKNLGVGRSDSLRSLRRERIQLGLEVSMAGERRMYAPGLPFMMVLLVLAVTITPTAYKKSSQQGRVEGLDGGERIKERIVRNEVLLVVLRPEYRMRVQNARE